MFIFPLLGLGVVIFIILIVIVMNNTKVSAKDFFLHLGAMVGLYASAIALGNLLFNVINKAFPVIANGYYYSSGPGLSFAVSTLIIIFPIFILLSYLLEREYKKDPEKEDSWVRRWSAYITLFISGAILAGDLVAILYKFLDGQELTVAFLLKALSILVIAILVFGYYLQDIRNKITPKGRKVWTIVVALIVLSSIVLGFSVIGSPRTQRLKRYDGQKISDIQNIQSVVTSYWHYSGSLPTDLASGLDFSTGRYGNLNLNQPDNGEPYRYRVLEDRTFEVCADFNFDSERNNSSRWVDPYSPSIPADWSYTAGNSCFVYKISEDAIPSRM